MIYRGRRKATYIIEVEIFKARLKDITTEILKRGGASEAPINKFPFKIKVLCNSVIILWLKFEVP